MDDGRSEGLNTLNVTQFVNQLCHWDHLWRKGPEPIACHFLVIEVEAQIEKMGFWVCNSSIQLVSVNLSYIEKL